MLRYLTRILRCGRHALCSRRHWYRLLGVATIITSIMCITLILDSRFYKETIARNDGVNPSDPQVDSRMALDRPRRRSTPYTRKKTEGPPLPTNASANIRPTKPKWHTGAKPISHTGAKPTSHTGAKPTSHTGAAHIVLEKIGKPSAERCPKSGVPERPKEDLKESFEFQKVSKDSTDSYVYSAHYDPRGSNPGVVIVGIATFYGGRGNEFMCQVWSTGSEETAELCPVGLNSHSETHALRYVPMFFKCNCQSTNGHPYAVSLVPTATSCGSPVNLLKVTSHDPASPPEVNFTVCVTPLNYNFDNYRQLVETIEVDRMFGAQRFFFYNFSTGSHVIPYMRSYAEKGIVNVLPWKIPVKVNILGVHEDPEIHYFGQLVALNDCLLRNLFRTRIIVFTDLDEIIVPHKHRNWIEMVEELRSGRSAASLQFRNSFFRTDYEQDGLYTGNKQVLDLELRTLLTTQRESMPQSWGWRSKHMVFPEAVQLVGIHHIEGIVDYMKYHVIDVHESVGLLHHYRSWKGEETQRVSTVTDRYMHRFNTTILSRVLEVHREVAKKYVTS